MSTRKKSHVAPEYPKVVETFMPVVGWELSRMAQDAPSAFNGNVRFRKYRITVEIVDEPIEILQERLEKLWVECDNHHHWYPLQNAAKSIGYTFKGECGSKKAKLPKP